MLFIKFFHILDTSIYLQLNFFADKHFSKKEELIPHLSESLSVEEVTTELFITHRSFDKFNLTASSIDGLHQPQ